MELLLLLLLLLPQLLRHALLALPRRVAPGGGRAGHAAHALHPRGEGLGSSVGPLLLLWMRWHLHSPHNRGGSLVVLLLLLLRGKAHGHVRPLRGVVREGEDGRGCKWGGKGEGREGDWVGLRLAEDTFADIRWCTRTRHSHAVASIRKAKAVWLALPRRKGGGWQACPLRGTPRKVHITCAA